MEVNKGDFIAIMGPSGSGKSTLLYSISGMDEITGGSVWFDGENLSAMEEEQRAQMRLKKMGFVFQNAQMLKTLTIMEYKPHFFQSKLCSLFLFHLGQILSAEKNTSACYFIHAADAVKQCRFSRPGRTHNGNKISFVHIH